MNSPSTVKPLKSIMNITTRVETVRFSSTLARITWIALHCCSSRFLTVAIFFDGSFKTLQLAWHPSSELLSISSHSKKEAFRLVHAPSFSVFSNWPTASTPLHSVSSAAFSSNGNQQRTPLASPIHVMLTGARREIRGRGQRQGQGASLQIETLQHVRMQCILQNSTRL